MGYIYRIENKINGKIYIGQTIRPIHKRIEEHRTGKSNGCRAIYNAIQYHGWENFDKDWYECPDEDLNFDEDLLVREMGTLAPEGYNLKEGGGATGKPSEEAKQKMREAQLGKTMSEESKQKMSESKLGENHNMYGKTHTDDTKRKMSEVKKGKKNSRYGKIHNEETKRKMSEAKLGEKNHTSKRVYQYDLGGTCIRSFGSTGEAGRHLKKYAANISACASGSDKYKTAYGFKWSYNPPSELFDL